MIDPLTSITLYEFLVFIQKKLKMKDRKAMDPSVRVAIVGFHKDIEVEYNLYQMSVVGSYRDAMHRLTQEKAKVSKNHCYFSFSTCDF